MSTIRWIVASMSALLSTLILAASVSVGAALSLAPGVAHADNLPCYSTAPNMTCITFVNSSSSELNVTVDGNYACYLNPGDRCSFNTPVGAHELAAQAGSDGPLMADQKGYLGKGPTSWSLSGNTQNGIFGNLQGDWTGLQPADLTNAASNNTATLPKGSYISSGITCDGKPCTSTTAFQPGSSAELFGTVIKPKGAPAGPEPKCTIIWSQLTGNEVTGPNSEVIHPGRVIGNHVVFGPDPGDFSVGGHCLEDPSVTTNQRSSLNFNSSNAPGAQSTGRKFAEMMGLAQSANTAQTPPRIQSPNPTYSNSSSNDSSGILLDIAAGVGLAAVLAGGGSSSSSSTSSSNGCPTSEFNTPVPCGCTTSNGITGCAINTCVPPGCSCPSDSGGAAPNNGNCINGASNCYCK